MFDWLRNLRKTEEEKRREQLTAYIDGALSTNERRAFEQELTRNEALRADLEAERQVKQLLSQVPRLRAPRNFTLNPAVYGHIQPTLGERLYPQLRLATAVMAVLLVGVISLEFFTTSVAPQVAAPAEVAVMSESDESSAVVQEAAPAAAEGESIMAQAEEAPSELAVTTEDAAENAAAGSAAADEPAADTAMVPAPTPSPAATQTAEASEEGMTTAQEESVAPRPSATVGPEVRAAESEIAAQESADADILSTPSLVPPAANSAGATVMPVSPDTAEVIAAQPVNYLRWLQVIVGIGTLLLLALTLYFRRQL